MSSEGSLNASGWFPTEARVQAYETPAVRCTRVHPSSSQRVPPLFLCTLCSQFPVSPACESSEDKNPILLWMCINLCLLRVRCLLHVCWTVERLEREWMWNGQATPGSGQWGSTGYLSLVKKVSWHISRGSSDLDVIVDIFWLLTRHPLLPSPLSNSSQGFLPVAEVGITTPLASQRNLIFLTWVLV